MGGTIPPSRFLVRVGVVMSGCLRIVIFLIEEGMPRRRALMSAWLEEGLLRERVLVSVLQEDRMLNVGALVSVWLG